MSKTTILYKDIAPGAAEDAEMSAQYVDGGSNLPALPFGSETDKLAVLELNAWGLDGSYDLYSGQEYALWSADLSGADGSFDRAPVITATLDRQYSSTGMTLKFNEATGEYCSAVNIKWCLDDTVKADVDFYPDSVEYFCEQLVQNYNKVVITLLKTHLPYRRAKLSQVMFGRLRTFGMDKIRNAAITNEMDLLTLELPASTLRWTLDSRENLEYMFQIKQPMEVRNRDDLLGVFYVEDSNRIGNGLYDIHAHNAFGVLEESDFAGGVYTNKSAQALFLEIVGADFDVFFELPDTTLTGAILPCTRRQAAQQVLFAWGACASTDGVEGIRVFSFPNSPVSIDETRTFQGPSVKTDSVVTQVVVTAHSYTESANGSVEIGGVTYKDTQTTYTVVNPNVTATEKQKIKKITDATLVSPAIGQAVAQRVYDYYARRNTHSSKIVWRGERLGDCVTLPNSWESTNTGNIVSMDIALSNTVVASCKSIGV